MCNMMGKMLFMRKMMRKIAFMSKIMPKIKILSSKGEYSRAEQHRGIIWGRGSNATL